MAQSNMKRKMATAALAGMLAMGTLSACEHFGGKDGHGCEGKDGCKSASGCKGEGGCKSGSGCKGDGGCKGGSGCKDGGGCAGH